MALSARELRNIGTVAAVVIFAGPLIVLYLSMSSWDPDEALKSKHELDRQRRREGLEERRRKAAEARARRAAHAKARAQARSSTGSKKPAGPVAVELKRMSNYKVEVTFTNVSEDDLRLAMPDGPGGLVRIAAEGKAPAPPLKPLFDEDRDDYVTKILVGDTHRIRLKRQAGFPRGPIRAVYDSRGDGVPAKAWRGEVESAPAK